MDEIPYDFVRRRLSVVVRPDSRPPSMITKGALDNVLEVCKQMQHGEASVPLDDARRAEIQQRFAAWSEQGYRVPGMA